MFYYKNNDTKPRLPCCEVTISNPWNSRSVEIVQAIIDTGADMSCIPYSLIESLGLSYSRGQLTQDFQGTIYSLSSSIVDIRIQDKISNIDEIRRIRVLCIEDTIAIIGRDILNNYKVVFNSHLERWGMNCSCSSEGCAYSML